MGSRISFAKGVLDEILSHAAGSPAEVCGLLFGTPDHVATALPCRNVAADPLTAFEIDPVLLLAAHRVARGGGPRPVGCYHSHPSGEASPSLRDAAAEPNGWVWVIVAKNRLSGWRAVADGARHGRFDAVVLVEP